MTARHLTSRLITLIVLHASATQAGDTIQIKLAHPVPSGTVWDKALEEMGAEIPSQELAAVHEMRRRGLRVIQSSDALEWTQETNRLAVSMRGTIVPADIFDQALNHRNAYRQRILPAGMRAERD